MSPLHKKKTKWSIRRIFYEAHLWLGIVSGLILFVVCLSGCIYVFRPDIEMAIEPEKYFVTPEQDAQKIPIDDLIARIEKEQNGRVTTMSMYDNPKRTTMMMVVENQAGKNRPDEGRSGGTPPQQGRPQGGHGRMMGKMLYVDPYTGTVRGEGASPASPFFVSMMRLHRFLWLPMNIGRPIVGIATIIFIVMLLSGLWLWIPAKWQHLKNWKMGFLVRVRKGGNRFLYDLHNTIGFYMLIPMLLLALTGLCWSFGWYRTAVGTVFGEPVFALRGQRAIETVPIASKDMKPLTIAELVAKTDALRPGRGDVSVSIPAPEANAAVVVQKGGYGFWAFAIKDRYEWNRNTGESVKIERFQDKAFGAKAVTLVRSIHFGDVLGLGSRIFFFIVCLVATSLPISGIWLWGNKLARRWKKKSNAASEGQSIPIPQTDSEISEMKHAG